jgi:hypothetical protein
VKRGPFKPGDLIKPRIDELWGGSTHVEVLLQGEHGEVKGWHRFSKSEVALVVVIDPLRNHVHLLLRNRVFGSWEAHVKHA